MISNQEIINRIDVLYNNAMSNQAPSLDAYEMSVYFNKAQLEVLKNHLNPKGNRYGEGFDGSSKRQLDFSTLVKSKTLLTKRDGSVSTYNVSMWTVDDEEFSLKKDVLSIINERVGIIDLATYNSIMRFIEAFPNIDIQHISDITSTIDYIIKGLPEDHPMRTKLLKIVNAGINALLSESDRDELNRLISEYRLPPTLFTVIEDMGIAD